MASIIITLAKEAYGGTELVVQAESCTPRDLLIAARALLTEAGHQASSDRDCADCLSCQEVHALANAGLKACDPHGHQRRIGDLPEAIQ